MLDQGKATGSPATEIVTPAPMDAALKAKWVEVLRSGKYTQAKNYLRRGEGFCCLGVLCEISGVSNWEPGEVDGAWFYGSGENRGFQCLPCPVKLAAKINNDCCDPLMEMNDAGQSFAQIAGYIEKNL